MDPKEFYRRVRQTASTIEEPYVVVCSQETTDGGQAGVLSYVNRETAARLLVRGFAVLATPEQSETYFAEDRQRRQSFEAAQWRNRIHVAVVRDGADGLVPPAAALPPEKDPGADSRK